MNSYLKSIGGIEPANARGPALVSTDAGTYGAFFKHQIPSIAFVGDRLFLANYGGQSPYADASGEDAGCYGRLMWSDDEVGPGMTFTKSRFWLWDVDTNAVQQPAFAVTPDNKLIFFYVFGGTGGYARSIRAQVLTNPLAAPGSWVWGRDVFVGVGFVWPTQMLRGSLYFCASESATGVAPIETWDGNKFTRIEVRDNICVPTQISKIPPVSPSTEIDYYETSIVELANGDLQAMFRTEGRQFVSNSADVGATWSAATAFTLLDTTSSRVNRINLPDGRIAMLYNKSLVDRKKMTLAILASSGTSVIGEVEVDPRGEVPPRPSYGSLALKASDPDNIYCAWDCGRGNQDPPTNTNEIIVAKVNIADAAVSILSMASKTLVN